MSDETHVFIASGDSCPVCSALDGTLVSAGYTAHDNCMCQTVPRKDDDAAGCEHHINDHVMRHGSGWADVTVGFEVEVRCPDGAVFASSSELNLSNYVTGDDDADMDAQLNALDEAMMGLVDELCSQCQPPKPFNCV